jgi:ABC-type multidrug transport system ATPase subunit
MTKYRADSTEVECPRAGDDYTPRRMEELAIDIRGLTKRFKGGVLANDAIDLEVRRGSIFGLLGPNGAGKTTLVRQLTGELAPSSGELRVLGVDVLREPLRAKGLMGIVPQEAGTFDGLTPTEHLRIFGQFRGLKRHQARLRTEELLRDLDLEAHRSKRAMFLSGGLKRKLLIGMAVVAKPPVLVLDEPTTGLDPNSRHEVWSMIWSMTGLGTTVLITTHNMEEAEALCDQVAIIGDGRMLARGSVEEIRSLSKAQFKAVYELDGRARSLYGTTHEEVLLGISKLGIKEYSLSKTSLEDLFMELTVKSEQP